MTEYDYSPEAYEAYLSKQAKISHWALPGFNLPPDVHWQKDMHCPSSKKIKDRDIQASRKGSRSLNRDPARSETTTFNPFVLAHSLDLASYDQYTSDLDSKETGEEYTCLSVEEPSRSSSKLQSQATRDACDRVLAEFATYKRPMERESTPGGHINSTLNHISQFTSFPQLQRAAKLALGFSDRIKSGQESEEDFRQLAHCACNLVYAIAQQPTFDSVTDSRLSELVRHLERIAALLEKAAGPRSKLIQIFKSNSDSKFQATIQVYRRTLAEFLELFGLNPKLSIKKHAANIAAEEMKASRLDIEQLPNTSDYRQIPPIPPFPHLHSSHGNAHLHSVGGNQSRVDSSHHTTNTRSGNTKVIIQDSVVVLGQESDKNLHQDWRQTTQTSSGSGDGLPTNDPYTDNTDDSTRGWEWPLPNKSCELPDPSATPSFYAGEGQYLQPLFRALHQVEGKVSQAIDNISKYTTELTKLSGVMEYLQRQIDSEKSNVVKFTGELTRLKAVVECFRLRTGLWSKNIHNEGVGMKDGGTKWEARDRHLHHTRGAGDSKGCGPGECTGVGLMSGAMGHALGSELVAPAS